MGAHELTRSPAHSFVPIYIQTSKKLRTSCALVNFEKKIPKCDFHISVPYIWVLMSLYIERDTVVCFRCQVYELEICQH